MDRLEWRFVRLASRVGLATLLVMSVSGRARAKPYFEARLGVGVVSGHYEFQDDYTTEDGYPAVAHDEGGPFGIPIDLGVSGGFAFDEQWALGLSARAEIAPYLEEVRPRYATLSTHLLVGFGPALTFRPARAFELVLTPEWVFLNFSGGRMDIGAVDNVFDFESLSGPGCGFSLGQRWASGFGLALGVNVAVISSEHQTFVPVSTLLTTSFSTF